MSSPRELRWHRCLRSVNGGQRSLSSVLDRLEAAHSALDAYHAKALIVAGRQEGARAFHEEVDRQMRARGLTPLASLAISDEQDAQRTLDDFRDQKKPGVLCTVNMAGEGYDCPDIAVIGYASNKLTSLFVRQVTARAMRVTDQERKLERVIPAAVVLPDAQALVEQLVSYLAPFTHEVLVASEEELSRRSAGGKGSRDETPFLPMPRYGLESARPDTSGTVTVPYADGSQEDVNASLAPAGHRTRTRQRRGDIRAPGHRGDPADGRRPARDEAV